MLKAAQEQAAADLEKAASEVREVDLLNPLTWGNVARNLKEIPEAAAAFLKLQAVTVVLWAVAVGGTLLTAYLLWRAYWQFSFPGVMRAERQAKAVAEEVAVEAAKATPAAPVVVAVEKTAKARAVRDAIARRMREEATHG
jgi:hypothetical protein